MNAPASSTPSHQSAAPAGGAVTCWHLVVQASADDPLVLARTLQKLAVPEIELRAVRFETGGAGTEARLDLEFLACADRASLAAVRVEKLRTVRRVGLEPAIVVA